MEKINWHDWFYYDETSPSCLRWKVSILSGKDGKTICVQKDDVAGSLNPSGYWQVGLDYKTFRTHRIILALHEKLVEPYVCDHINGLTSDNRLCNLRATSRLQNNRNSGKRYLQKNTTGIGFIINRHGITYTRVYHNDLSGTQHHKYFNVEKLGIMVAFRDAVIYRQKMIEELNSQGAGYTDRHGKDN